MPEANAGGPPSERYLSVITSVSKINDLPTGEAVGDSPASMWRGVASTARTGLRCSSPAAALALGLFTQPWLVAAFPARTRRMAAAPSSRSQISRMKIAAPITSSIQSFVPK